MMLTYRAHIYTLAMEASGAAVDLGLSLSRCVSLPRGPDRDVRLLEEMPDIERQAAALENAVTELLSALPKEVSGSVTRGDQGLLRHLRWINRRVKERIPTACAGDASDIAAQDIPEVLRYFDAWHERQSPAYPGLVERVTPLISVGQLDSALRFAWVYFKTRMVETFGLPENLDGTQLFNALFSDSGRTAGILPNSEREAYLNLFRGLYVLNRNPVGHNDVEPNPEEFEAVLSMINSALVRMDKARQEGKV